MLNKTQMIRKALGLLWMATLAAPALTLDNESATHATLGSTTVTMSGHSELHLTGPTDPIPGTTINLTSEDSWVFFHHPSVVPSYTRTTLLPRISVNGAAAVAGGNVVIANYDNGSVVIPHPAGFKPLTVHTSRHFTGDSWQPDLLGIHTSFGSLPGSINNRIRSFTLKRGYMATFSENSDGTGNSRVYIAQDSDLEVAAMPAGLDENISFVRVLPWQWTTKKGVCDRSPGELNARWNYNWNIWQPGQPEDYEYVAIKQQPFWPGLDTGYMNWLEVTHLSGFNEPDNPVEDAYQNLTPQGSVADAVARMPELLATGLRVGAPAVTDGGYSWIVDFVNQAKAAGHRLDYVPVHYYRAYWNQNDPNGAANDLYNFLKSIHDATGLPIWLTEFNNGANWTNNAYDPTVDQNRDIIEAMINMMDGESWIERYAIYSAVEWFRQTHYDEGGITPMGAMYRDHVSPIAHVQVVPDSGLAAQAKYLFSDRFRDSSGSGNHPLVYGTPKIVPTGTFTGEALSLDGTDDHLVLPPMVAGGSDFTFAAWVRWDGGGNWQRIFDFGTGTTEYMFLTPSNGGNLRFAIRNGGGEQTLSSSPLAAATWTHVAVTLEGGTGTLYVNGGPVDSQPISINPSDLDATRCYLGESQFDVDPLFDGMLDSIYILDQALSPGEVAQLASTSDLTAPADPTGLEANAGIGKVKLDWNDSTGLDFASYSVYRSATSGSGHTLVASGLSLSEFEDDTVTNGLTYYYVVTASDTSGNESGNSNEEVANPRDDILIAHYRFEGDFRDSSGLDHHGSASGSPTFLSGPVNLAADFDGADNLLTLPVGIADGSDITIATWVYWRGGGQWQRVFDFGTDPTHNLFLTPRSGSNTLRFAITETGGAGEQRLNGPQLATNQWVHVAVVLDGNVGTLYVDGVAVDTGTITVNPGDFNPTTNLIGDSQYAADPLLNGALDDFRVYSYPLDAGEIADLVDHTEPAAPAPAASLAWWRFEGGPDSSDVVHGAATGYPNYAPDIADSSGSGNELSMWQTGGGTGFSYDNDVPSGEVAQTGDLNQFSIQNTNGYPASFTEPGGPLSPVELAEWTVEVSWKPENGGFRTVVGRNGNQLAGPTSGLAALYIGATPDDELRVVFVDEDGHVHETKSGTGYVAGFDFATDPEGTTGTWYHIAAVSDGSTLSLYNNGSLVSSLDLTASGSANTALTNGTTTAGGVAVGGGDVGGWTVGYGMYNGNHTDRAFGLIDEVRISASALPYERLLSFDPDTDNDNLRDTWELANFRNRSQNGFGDPDGDGANNEAEETAGTVPTISDLTPAITTSTSGSTLTLSWPGNHTGWRLMHSGDLEGPWTMVPGSDEVNSWDLDLSQQPRQGYYRLEYP